MQIDVVTVAKGGSQVVGTSGPGANRVNDIFIEASARVLKSASRVESSTHGPLTEASKKMMDYLMHAGEKAAEFLEQLDKQGINSLDTVTAATAIGKNLGTAVSTATKAATNPVGTLADIATEALASGITTAAPETTNTGRYAKPKTPGGGIGSKF